jgi:hypothetical protein
VCVVETYAYVGMRGNGNACGVSKLLSSTPKKNIAPQLGLCIREGNCSAALAASCGQLEQETARCRSVEFQDLFACLIFLQHVLFLGRIW